MHGWLVVNEFLNRNQKFSEHTRWLSDAANACGISLKILGNLKVWQLLGTAAFKESTGAQTDLLEALQKNCPPLPDFVLFWDKDIRLAAQLEQLGLRLYNRSSAIEACDDKTLTYVKLFQSGIPMPRTLIGPKIYSPVSWEETEFPDTVSDLLGFPCILKEAFGSFGEQVFFIKDRTALLAALKRLGTAPFLVQELVSTSFGRDLRIQVVGDEAIAAMYRRSATEDFRANISRGGRMEAYEPDEVQTALAKKACACLGLDFAGVDLLFGEHGEPLLCEVNSNAHFVNIHSATGVNAAEAILRYISTL